MTRHEQPTTHQPNQTEGKSSTPDEALAAPMRDLPSEAMKLKIVAHLRQRNEVKDLLQFDLEVPEDFMRARALSLYIDHHPRSEGPCQDFANSYIGTYTRIADLFDDIFSDDLKQAQAALPSPQSAALRWDHALLWNAIDPYLSFIDGEDDTVHFFYQDPEQTNAKETPRP